MSFLVFVFYNVVQIKKKKNVKYIPTYQPEKKQRRKTGNTEKGFCGNFICIHSYKHVKLNEETDNT